MIRVGGGKGDPGGIGPRLNRESYGQDDKRELAQTQGTELMPDCGPQLGQQIAVTKLSGLSQ